MGLFLAEFKYSYWSGLAVKEESFSRIVKAPVLKMAEDKAFKYWEKIDNGDYGLISLTNHIDLTLVSIKVSEPIDMI